MAIKKQFVVEIEIPENTGDLCWDQDETGLQAFHDCVVSVMSEVNLKSACLAANEREEFQKFIERQNDVRSSLRVISPHS